MPSRRKRRSTDASGIDEGGYLYDVVDGEQGCDDHCAFRPNQLLAISLDHPVLDAARWKPVMEQVAANCSRPSGCAASRRAIQDYKPTYDGDLRSRDAAYHQGTVWAWLIGPYIDAWLRVIPRPVPVPRLLGGFEPHLAKRALGSISEVFDAEAPYLPAAASPRPGASRKYWRCWVKTAPSAVPVQGRAKKG